MILDQIGERALAGDALEGLRDVDGSHSCGDGVPTVGPVVAEDDEAGMAFKFLTFCGILFGCAQGLANRQRVGLASDEEFPVGKV